MKVIERYILRRTFGVLAGALFWTLAIVWTTQVLSRLDLVTDSGQSAATFFEIATLILPSVVPIVLSFAVLIAVAQTLTTMNTDSELVVISAAGSPRSTVIRPILLLALGASIFAFVIDNTVDPYARQRGRELVAEARADLISLVIQEGVFRKVEDGLFVQIAQRLPDGRLGGIFVADSRNEGLDLIYYAKTGVVTKKDDNNVLVMQDGEVHRKTVEGDVSVIRFTSNSFDLSSFTSGSDEIRLLPKDHTLPYLFNPDPGDKVFQQAPQQYRAEIHRRLTEWVWPFVFALIALAVAGDPRSHREGRIHPVVTAVVIALFERWLGFYTADQAQRQPFFSALVYAVPISASVVAALFILFNRSLELPVSTVERLAGLIRRLRDRWTAFRWGAGRGAGASAGAR